MLLTLIGKTFQKNRFQESIVFSEKTFTSTFQDIIFLTKNFLRNVSIYPSGRDIKGSQKPSPRFGRRLLGPLYSSAPKIDRDIL